jgi:hypothetical protein
MFLIKHRMQDQSGNILRDEILPDIYMTTAQCAVMMERMSGKFDISDYNIHRDTWWGRQAENFGETHFWWAAPVGDMLRRDN